LKVIFKHHRLYWDVLIILALLMILILPWQNWFDDSVRLARASQPVSWEHPLGTDDLGRDHWLRAVDSLRGTLPWLWLGVLSGVLGGLFLGLIRLGFAQSCLTKGLWRFVELLATLIHGIPLPVAAFFAMVLFQGQGLITLAICLAIIMVMRSYFFVTSNYRRSARLGYWQAHAGLGGMRILRVWRYGICGHWRDELFLSVAFYMKVALITEISVSYLGFGVQEPRASFGNLLGSQLRNFFDGELSLLVGALALIALACAAPFSLQRCFKAWPAIRRGQKANLAADDQFFAQEKPLSHRNI